MSMFRLIDTRVYVADCLIGHEWAGREYVLSGCIEAFRWDADCYRSDHFFCCAFIDQVRYMLLYAFCPVVSAVWLTMQDTEW